MAEQSQKETKALAPIERLKVALKAESVQEQFQNALAENRGQFIASLIDIYATDRTLQECPPNLVILEALKAATLKLPINRSLGFAWIVPYKGKPQMQIGYKGYVQLAQRTGQYRYINADVVYEGELVSADKLTGEIDLSGERKSDNVVGYFAHIETVNGFRKTSYWSKDQVLAHAKRFSRAFGSKDAPWQTSFDAMALKTVISSLLRTYGLLSTEMMNAIAADRDLEDESSFAQEAAEKANSQVIDVEFKAADAGAEEPPAKKPEPEF